MVDEVDNHELGIPVMEDNLADNLAGTTIQSIQIQTRSLQ